jgi:hypothetical protein
VLHDFLRERLAFSKVEGDAIFLTTMAAEHVKLWQRDWYLPQYGSTGVAGGRSDMSTTTDILQAGGAIAAVAIAYLAWKTSREANRISIATREREDRAKAEAIEREELARAAAQAREAEADRLAQEREEHARKQVAMDAQVQPLEQAVAFATKALRSYYQYNAVGGLTSNIGKPVPRPAEVDQWLERAPDLEAKSADPEIVKAIARLRDVIKPIELPYDWSNASMRGSVRFLIDAGEPAIRDAEELLAALKAR